MALLQLFAYGIQGGFPYPSTSTSWNVKYKRNEYFTLEPAIDCAMNRETLKIKLNALLLIHLDVLNKINICDPFVVPVLKNIECPITYNNIKNDFIDCAICKTCYDYSNEKVIQWFSSRRKCSICRSTMKNITKNIQGYNTIFYELKLKFKQVIHDDNDHYDDDDDEN
jgi:hypothetical protein